MRMSSGRRRIANFSALVGVVAIGTGGIAVLRTESSGFATVAVATRVRITTPDPAPQSYEVRLPARTVAIEEALVYSRATGTALRRFADLGQDVEAGQPLATISAPEVDQELVRARASAQQAAARERLALVTLDRARQLVERGFVSRQLLDERKAAADVAGAERAGAQAEVRRLEQLVGYQTVRAPFAGRITERLIDRGSRVVADQGQSTPLFRLARIDRLRVLVDVPQGLTGSLRSEPPVSMAFQVDEETTAASVARVSGLVDADTGTMRVELEILNAGGRLAAGTEGQVTLLIARDRPAYLVRANAVVQRGGKPHVAVLKQDGIVAFRPVALGRAQSDDIELLGGVGPHNRVIRSPKGLLVDGSAAQPVVDVGSKR